jgi:membrane protease YdiL (CAAX protease family)
MTPGTITGVSARSSPPHLSVGVRSVTVFAGLLYLTWCSAWVCERALESHVGWLRTDSGAFLYWTTAKLVLWVLPALALIHRSGRSLAAVLGLRRLRALFLWGGGAGLALVANGLITREIDHRSLLPVHLSWSVANAVLIAPIVEELAFRGTILGILREHYRFWLANGVTAMLFVGAHVIGWSFEGRVGAMLTAPIGRALSIFFLGMIFGVVAERSGSVAASTLTHLLNNLWS